MILLLVYLIMLAFNLTGMIGLITDTAIIQQKIAKNNTLASEQLVRDFLLTVRSGKVPDKAGYYMAEKVLAHQVNAEDPQTVLRTPQNYAAHLKEFQRLYGQFDFEITELIAQENKVHARWKQTGKHLAEIDGYPATGLPLVEVASAVYRIENGKIAEYWIQIDRAGFNKQLQQQSGRK